ncbi:MAG: hypothetical protein RLZZ245_2338, partial [Verrucomicrobiota bacterium]
MQLSDGIFLTNSHHSNDGITWNPVQYPSHSYWLNCSGYGAGTFVLTGAVGQIFTSSNFSNWTNRSPRGEDITNVVFGNGTFVARKFWSTGDMWVSKNNGVTWTSVDTGDAPDRSYNSVAFGNNKFIYPLDNRVRTSADGINWTQHTIASIPSGFLMRHCRHFTGEKFIGSAESARTGSNVTITTGLSTDGVSWSFKQASISSSSTASFFTVGADSGHLLLLSESAPAEVWLSEDEGSSWAKIGGPWATSDNIGAYFAIKGDVIAVATSKGIYSAPMISAFEIAIQDSTNGQIFGGGAYSRSASATLTATPNPGYRLSGWTGDASGMENPLTITMDADKTVGATFERDLADNDGDSLSNYDEMVLYGTDPNNLDTDGDGMIDGDELQAGRDPLKREVSLALGALTQTYDGSIKTVTAISGVEGVSVNILYNGNPTGPVDSGIYEVTASIADPLYTGSASGTLIIDKALAAITLSDLSQTYDGSSRPATFTTSPPGVAVALTYEGSAVLPVLAGSYGVIASITDPNYTGTASGTLVIGKAPGDVVFSNLPRTYDGAPKPIYVTTTPLGLGVTVTYDGATTAPTAAGTYAVVAIIDDSNHIGAASGELVITKGSQTITFTPIPNQTLDETTVQLFASADSGLQPIFSVVSGPAVVSGNTLSILGIGSIVVEASQAGDGNWNAVGSVQRNFHVFSGTFAQDFVWAKGFGGSNSDTAYSIATDSEGNALVAVDFTGAVAFGGGNLTSSGSSDLALLKVAVDGRVLSSTRFGGANTDYAKAVSVDSANNVILAGEFMTSTSMGGVTHASSGSKDISLLKVNSAGTLQWSKRFGGTLSDSVYGLATDVDGNILLAGDFSGSITFGATTLTSSGNRDGFVAKLDPSGTPLWAMKVGGTGNDTAFAVTVSPSGQILVGGSFSLNASFGTISRTSAGGTDGFAMGVSSAGSVQWVSRFGGSSNDSGRAVAVDSTGSACVAGNFAGTDATFGTEVLASEGLDDAFVVRLDVTNGAFLTVKQCGGAGADAGLGLAADPFGSLYLSGSYSGTAYFDGHTLITPQGPDAFVAKLSVDGNFLWALAGGGAANDSATSITADRAGHVFVAGLFAQAARVGSHDVAGGGLVDLFVAKINGPTPSFVSTPGSVTVDVGDPFFIAAPAVGADPITYQWFKGAEALAGKTSATLEIPAATIDDQGIYHAVATNFYGSAQITDVNVIVRVPDRVLSLESPSVIEENRAFDVPIYLDSAGELTGLTMVLPYNLDLLRNPSFIFGPHLSLANSSVVVNNVAGTVRVVGSAFPFTIPAGRQLIGTFRFITRSVPDNASVTFAPTLSSVSDLFGSPLDGYTKMGTTVMALAQRDIPGDANNNGRLDGSDAAELIRLYANPAQIRTWDHYLNDLNLDTILTEGDATRVLRVVADLDEVPSFPESLAPMTNQSLSLQSAPLAITALAGSTSTSGTAGMKSVKTSLFGSGPMLLSAPLLPPAARMVLTRLTGANANKLLAQVYLDNVPAG